MKRVLIILLTLFTLNLSAQSALKDPMIPQGETIRYRLTQREEQEFSYQIVTQNEFDGKQYYQVENQSVKEVTKSRILRDPMIPLYGEKHLYSGRAESQSTQELLSIPQLEENEIGLLDMNDMAFLLRGFPFDKPREMELTLLDQQAGESPGMAFRVFFRGKEKLSIDGIEYEAYKLEMKAELKGAMALFSGMIPKTYFWYDQKNAHRLLKFTGSGGPGTDEMLMEMVDYNS